MVKIATDADGRIAIRGLGHDSTATLTLLPEGMELGVPGGAAACLAWGDYRRPITGSRRGSKSGWVIEHSYDYPRIGPVGVAIRAWGKVGTSCRKVRAETVQGGRRVLLATRQSGQRIPVQVGMDRARDYREFRDARERATFDHLAWLLRDRSNLRPRLADPDRSAALVDSMNAGLQLAPGRRSWSNAEGIVLGVMNSLGYRHPFGRPLSAAQVTPFDEVVDRTVAELSQQHGTSARVSQRSWVEAVVLVAYSELEPWPYANLVDD